MFVHKGARRQPNAERARVWLDGILRDQLGAAEFERLTAEGATLGEDAVCQLALAD